MVEAVDPDHDKLHSPGEHDRVIEAVLNGKPLDAASAMAQHMEIFYERLLKMENMYREKVSKGLMKKSNDEI